MSQLVSWLTHFICQRDFIIGITGSLSNEPERSAKISVKNNASRPISVNFVATTSFSTSTTIYSDKTSTISVFPKSLICIYYDGTYSDLNSYQLNITFSPSSAASKGFVHPATSGLYYYYFVINKDCNFFVSQAS